MCPLRGKPLLMTLMRSSHYVKRIYENERGNCRFAGAGLLINASGESEFGVIRKSVVFRQSPPVTQHDKGRPVVGMGKTRVVHDGELRATQALGF